MNGVKTCVLGLLLLMSVLLLWMPTVQADIEPNDGFDTAEVITAGEIHGYVNATDPKDYYKIQLAPSSIITVTFSSDSDWNQYLYFYDPSKGEIICLESSNESEDYYYYHLAHETAVDYWFFMVECPDGANSAGNYTIYITIEYQDDAGSGGDIAEDYENAFEISADVVIMGHLEDLDDKDMYKVRLTSGSIVTINFSADSDWNQYLYFYDPSKGYVFELESANYDDDSVTYYLSYETATDYWYLEINSPDGLSSDGDYYLDVSVGCQNDAGSGNDVVGGYENALEIGIDTVISGHVENLDDKDMYKTQLTGGSNVKITYSAESDWNQYLYFYTPAHERILELPSSGTSEVNETYSIPSEVASDYWFIEIVSTDGAFSDGDYTFKVQLITPVVIDTQAPTITHTHPGDQDIDQEFTITATITDDVEVTSATLHYRLEGAGTYKTRTMSADGNVWSTIIPAEEMQKGVLQYYITATDAAGNMQNWGAEDDPNWLTVVEPKKKEEKATPGFDLSLLIVAIGILALMPMIKRH